MKKEMYMSVRQQKTFLSQRMDNHRKDYKLYKVGKRKNGLTVFDIFDKFGIENCVIELLELVNCNSKDELLVREAYYIRTLKCVNKVIPLRSKQQYDRDNRDNCNKNNRIYREKHKEKLHLKTKCSCGGTYTPTHKTRHLKTILHTQYCDNVL